MNFWLEPLEPPKRSGSLGIQIACCISMLLNMPAAISADFKHATKTFVPSTQIDRRLDFTALQDKAASIDVNTKAKLAKAASLSAKNMSSKSMLALRQKASELIRQGKLSEAEDLLKSAHKKLSADQMLANGLSQVSLQKARGLAGSNVDGAIGHARQALSYDPNNSAASKLLDDLHRKSGINPGSQTDRLKLADQLAAEHKFPESLVEYRAAQKIKPSAHGHTGLGNLAVVSNQTATAKKEFESAIALNPNAAFAHRQLGLLKLSTGDIIGANTD